MILQLPAPSSEPVYRQIAGAIADRVDRGLLRPGDRIPSTREMAAQLGVNRTTVCLAYEELKKRGVIESRVGSGSRIAGGSRHGGLSKGSGSVLDWHSFLSTGMLNLARRIPARAAESSRVLADFSRLVPDPSLFPVAPLEEIFNKVIRERGPALLQYGPALGLPQLRSLIAERMRRWDVRATAEEILIVNGAQQGMDLVLKAFIDPGDIVVVESPTYSNILPLLGFYRARVVGIPMTAEGLDLNSFRAAAAQRTPKLVYTIPNLQNPTGICTSAEHRRQLLAIAEEFNVPVLEDGYEEDLRTDGRSIHPIKAADRSGRVIYLGTFSKGLFPGLRIGWIVAHPSLIETLGMAKFSTDYHTSLLLQAALTEFIAQGHYDQHLQRLQKILAGRLRVAVESMKRYFPRSAAWTLPQGGYSLWVTLPPAVSARRLAVEAQRDGVLIASGDHFYQSSEDSGSFRLSVSTVSEGQIQRGIQILGKAIARQARAQPVVAPVAELPYI
ncbi:MAG: PLP-dependent aminotransferase family protein [Acidobacteria bacterium]|nr:PLP-dependent aminotransferase family protein [Acidobacteriota bacterium]